VKPATGIPENIGTAARLLHTRALRASDLIEACLARIDAHDTPLRAFITVDADGARAAAELADRELDAGRSRGPLHGVPIALKDLLDQRGLPTTAGSRSMHVVAEHDAPSVAHLRAAGAVLVGKTNMHEFAMGTTSDDSGYGAARHPLALSRSPGGSSGGSAIAVVTDMCLGAIGSDTGGSIRIPAAACGLVGLKPAWGAVSLDGVVPLSPTLDCVGPLARTVDDAWHLLDGLTGQQRPLPDAPALAMLRARVPRAFIDSAIAPEVHAVFTAALERLTQAGLHTSDVSLALADEIVPAYVAIVMTEALHFHAPRMTEHAEQYTPRVRSRLDGVAPPEPEVYQRALDVRRHLEAEVTSLVDDGAVLVLPALAIEPPPVGADAVRVGEAEMPVRAAMLRLTQPFNLSRHAALTLPCGTTPAGFPVGLQVVGRSTTDVVACGRTLAAAMAS